MTIEQAGATWNEPPLSVDERRERTHAIYSSTYTDSVAIDDTLLHPVARGLVKVQGLPFFFQAIKSYVWEQTAFNGERYKTPWRACLPIPPDRVMDSRGSLTHGEDLAVLFALDRSFDYKKIPSHDEALEELLRTVIAERQAEYDKVQEHYVHSQTFRQDFQTAVAAILEDFETQQGIFEQSMVS